MSPLPALAWESVWVEEMCSWSLSSLITQFPAVPSSSQQERELKQPGNLSDKRKNCPAASPTGQQEGMLVTVWPFPGGRVRAREDESRGSGGVGFSLLGALG